MSRCESTRKQQFLVFLFFAFIIGFSSCRTGRELPAGRIKSISAEKLLDNARNNAFDFDHLTIRRINVQFSDMGTNTSFRASIKANRDEKILASISKLNIPVGRVLLTPDSITYVNYIDKNYFEGDYSFLNSLLNFRLNFNVVQAVISNPVKSGIDGSGGDLRRYSASVEDGMYVLQPEYKPHLTNPEQRKISFRNNKNRVPFTDDELVIRKLMFNPYSFVLEKLVMEDPADDRKLEVDFSDFVKIDGYDYPGAIDINMATGDELTELNIKLRGFSTDKVEILKPDIPDRYQRIRSR